MKIISRLRDQRYCAFCRTPRQVYLKKHVDTTNVLASVVFAMAVTYALFGEPDPRGLIIFCLAILASEVFVYIRWRSFVSCKLCGFDPVLYKRSPALASARVREFFMEQAKNPSFLLSKSPLVALHRRQVELERRKRKYEGILASSSGRAKAPVVHAGKDLRT
jgi:hypothetical protein